MANTNLKSNIHFRSVFSLWAIFQSNMHSTFDFWPRPARNEMNVKDRGPILQVMWPALGSDDLNLDQSGTNIQILQEPT